LRIAFRQPFLNRHLVSFIHLEKLIIMNSTYQVHAPQPVPFPAVISSGTTIWLTGLSGAGKTTIGQELVRQLQAAGEKVEFLDGDLLRQTICRGLGFSYDDRCENIRRIGFLAELLTRHGVNVIVAAISPYQSVRDEVRQRVEHFLEVYVNAPLSICEQRDVKGLYQRTRAGEIQQFTGVSDPYEPPHSPEVICFTDRETIAESVAKILTHFQSMPPQRSGTNKH
jgi:adenylyl-sulfate kinase